MRADVHVLKHDNHDIQLFYKTYKDHADQTRDHFRLEEETFYVGDHVSVSSFLRYSEVGECKTSRIKLASAIVSRRKAVRGTHIRESTQKQKRGTSDASPPRSAWLMATISAASRLRHWSVDRTVTPNPTHRTSHSLPRAAQTSQCIHTKWHILHVQYYYALILWCGLRNACQTILLAICSFVVELH